MRRPEVDLVDVILGEVPLLSPAEIRFITRLDGTIGPEDGGDKDALGLGHLSPKDEYLKHAIIFELKKKKNVQFNKLIEEARQVCENSGVVSYSDLAYPYLEEEGDFDDNEEDDNALLQEYFNQAEDLRVEKTSDEELIKIKRETAEELVKRGFQHESQILMVNGRDARKAVKAKSDEFEIQKDETLNRRKKLRAIFNESKKTTIIDQQKNGQRVLSGEYLVFVDEFEELFQSLERMHKTGDHIGSLTIAQALSEMLSDSYEDGMEESEIEQIEKNTQFSPKKRKDLRESLYKQKIKRSTQFGERLTSNELTEIELRAYRNVEEIEKDNIRKAVEEHRSKHPKPLLEKDKKGIHLEPELIEEIVKLFKTRKPTYIDKFESIVEEMRLLDLENVWEKSEDDLRLAFQRSLSIFYDFVGQNMPDGYEGTKIDFARELFPGSEEILMDPNNTEGLLSINTLMDIVANPYNRPVDEASWLRFSLASALVRIAYVSDIVEANYNEEEVTEVNDKLADRLEENYPRVTLDTLDQVRDPKLKEYVRNILISNPKSKIYLMQIIPDGPSPDGFHPGNAFQVPIELGPPKSKESVIRKMLSKRVTDYASQVTDFNRIRCHILEPWMIEYVLASLFKVFGADTIDGDRYMKDTFGGNRKAAEYSTDAFEYFKVYFKMQGKINDNEAINKVENQIIKVGFEDDHKVYEVNQRNGIYKKLGLPIIAGDYTYQYRNFVIDLIDYVGRNDNRSIWYDRLLTDILSNPVNRKIVDGILQEEIGRILQNQDKVLDLFEDLFPEPNEKQKAGITRIREIFNTYRRDKDRVNLHMWAIWEDEVEKIIQTLVDEDIDLQKENAERIGSKRYINFFEERAKYRKKMIDEIFKVRTVDIASLKHFIDTLPMRFRVVKGGDSHAEARIQKNVEGLVDIYNAARDGRPSLDSVELIENGKRVASHRKSLTDQWKKQIKNEVEYMLNLKGDYNEVDVRRLLTILISRDSRRIIKNMLAENKFDLRDKILRILNGYQEIVINDGKKTIVKIIGLIQAIENKDIKSNASSRRAQKDPIFNQNQINRRYADFEQDIVLLDKLLKKAA